MFKTYRVSIIKDFKVAIWKIIAFCFGIILPITVYGILLGNEVISHNNSFFMIAFPLYLILVVASTMYFISKLFVKEMITFKDNAFESNLIGIVLYNEVLEHESLNVRGNVSQIITLKNGKKISFGPTNNFSRKAEKVYFECVAEFDKRLVV